jgi:dienelactone hydrolase
MFHVKRLLGAVFVWVAAFAACAAGEAVVIPGTGVELNARLYQPDGPGPFPAIVMMHGCSGMWDRQGTNPTANYRFWAEHFQKLGYVSVLVDSFGSRGEREICTQNKRTISVSRERPQDAYAALRWLVARKDVDATRVHLMGWSNGAMAVLETLQSGAAGHTAAGPQFRSAVAFYPGCAAHAKGGYHPVAPLLIESGAADDWTPARYCEAMVGKADKAGAPIEIDVYEGAHHGFDGPVGKVHVRPEVRNPNNPGGWGATVGPNPEARAKAIERATQFLARK